jgi:hypothetical protein
MACAQKANGLLLCNTHKMMAVFVQRAEISVIIFYQKRTRSRKKKSLVYSNIAIFSRMGDF